MIVLYVGYCNWIKYIIGILHIFVYKITRHTTHVTIKIQVSIRNTAHRPSMQAHYMIGSGMTMHIAARHNIFPQIASYMSWIILVLVGIDSGVSCLGDEIVSHNTTDARHIVIGLKSIERYWITNSRTRWCSDETYNTLYVFLYGSYGSVSGQYD